METRPARALVAAGVAALTMFGTGAVPTLAGTGSTVRPDRPSTSASSSVASTHDVLAGKRHAHKHRHKHRMRKHKHRHRHHVPRPRTRGVMVPTSGRYAGAVDTADRTAVDSAYRSSFASGLAVPTGFTGDESRCQAGTSSAESRAATLRAVNFVRSLAGLAPVTFSTELNNRSQLSALMMSANRALSHSPPSSWKCYTSAGAANAGRSNLALAYPELTSAGLVRLYTTDPGSSNAAAGHRRWLLNPFATVMGTGSTRTANAMSVIGPSSSSRPNPTWVGWPSAGYFPNTLEPGGRWSLSSGSRGASFGNATVRVYRDGKPISAAKNRVESGYGQPTLVWQIPPSEARSGTYRVQVSGIKLGSSTYATSYDVRMFAPGGG